MTLTNASASSLELLSFVNEVADKYSVYNNSYRSLYYFIQGILQLSCGNWKSKISLLSVYRATWRQNIQPEPMVERGPQTWPLQQPNHAQEYIYFF